MVLRPATPLAILLLAAFVLLLLSVISTPIVKAIPLATFRGVDFGVFGYCKGSQCSNIRVGYNTDGLFGGGNNDSDFSLPSGARHSLSSILIVHPVAALLTLICFILAATAHLHSPSHSPRYLLILLILLLPTLLVTLLAFLVDILLFVPHLQWGGWLVLAATILITASGIVTCAMRRTLVSRKARKKRIAENAEMNGENYYNRQQAGGADSPPPLGAQPAAPMVNGGHGADKLPAFATFDVNQKRRTSDDERIPLNNRTPSSRTAPSPDSTGRPGMIDDGLDRYVVPGRGGPRAMGGGRGGRGYGGPRDEFGNPLNPSAAFGPMPPPGFRKDSSESRLRNQHSNETMGSTNSRGGPYGGRGRGGFPPRGGYNRGGPYGGGRGGPPPGLNDRGIPMGPMAVGAGAGMMAGEMPDRGQRGPPPGYSHGYPPQGRGGPGQYGREHSPAPYGPQSAYGRRGQSPGPAPAPAYSRQPSPGRPSNQIGYGYSDREPIPMLPPGLGALDGNDRTPPPQPRILPVEGVVGQAIEMDASTGSPSQTPGFAPPNQLRENDADVQGMVALQQNRQDPMPRSPTSLYGGEQSYVPPRAAWAGAIGRNGTPPVNSNQPLAPIHGSPVELPAQHSNQTSQQPLKHSRMNSSDTYYEDVDPRFAEPEPPIPNTGAVPDSLMPGHAGEQQIDRGLSPGHHLDPSSSYESIQEGARSPATSDTSHFTSISQRGVNPNWRPPPNGMGMGQGMGGVPNRRPMQQQQPQQRDVLNSNPDFELAGGMRGGIGGRPGRSGSSPGHTPISGPGNSGRYPANDM